MFGFNSRRRIEKYLDEVRSFIRITYTEPVQVPVPKPPQKTESSGNTDQGVKYSLPSRPSSGGSVKYSLPTNYDEITVDAAMRTMLKTGDSKQTSSLLEKAKEQTFTEYLIEYIRENHLRDNKVYQAAQLDRRLFSKIMSDMHYKPSKDTALALSYALRLSVDQDKDLISRAGYTL